MPSRPRSPAACRRTRAAQPRSVRRDLRARRPRLRHRGGRGIPVALRRGARAPAPLGARRLAAPAVAASWILGRAARRCRPLGRWKMLDNLRRSLSAPASFAALVAGWMLPLQAALALVDRLRRVDDRGRAAASRARRDRAAARADHAAQPPARARRRPAWRCALPPGCWSRSSRTRPG